MKPLPNRIPELIAPETRAYWNGIQGAGGTILMGSLQSIDRFVRNCQLTTLWSKLLEVMPLAGADLNSALIKLKHQGVQGMTAVNFVAGDYTEAGGLLGNGSTKYLNANFSTTLIPAACHMAAYVREDVPGTSARAVMGSDNATTQFWRIEATNPQSAVRAALGGNVFPFTPELWSKGWWYAERVNNSSMQLYKGTAQRGTDGTSVTPTTPSQNLFLFALNNNGTPGNYFNARASFFTIGQNLTTQERTDLYTYVQQLQADLGRAV